MKKYAVCLVLATTTGCTTTVEESGLRKGVNLTLEVESVRMARG